MSEKAPGHLSALTLGLLVAGKMTPEEEQWARAHLRQCPDCSQRLDQTSSSADHFQRVVKPRTVEALRRRLEQTPPPPPARRPWARYGLGALLALLAAGALLWVLHGR